jgi:hypothetical protein
MGGPLDGTVGLLVKAPGSVATNQLALGLSGPSAKFEVEPLFRSIGRSDGLGVEATGPQLHLVKTRLPSALAIRDLWTKLQFELLKELTALNNAADKVAAVPAARERIRALAQAFCDDINRASTSELADWRTEFVASLSELADTAKRGSDEATKLLQEAVKQAEKSAADAKSTAETATKALAEAGRPGSLNVTVSGDFDGEVVMSGDGVEVARGSGKSIAIERVVPGIRKFSALAQKGAQRLEASQMIEVKPGLQDLRSSLT